MGLGFDFPQDSGNVNGASLFYAWGTYSSPIIGIQGISDTWTQGGAQVNGQVQTQIAANGVWSAQVTGNIPTGTQVTLTVTALVQPNPPQPPIQVPSSITFTFLGPSPQS